MTKTTVWFEKATTCSIQRISPPPYKAFIIRIEAHICKEAKSYLTLVLQGNLTRKLALVALVRQIYVALPRRQLSYGDVSDVSCS